MITFNELNFAHNKKQGFQLGPINYKTQKNLIVKGSNGSGKTTLLKCIARILKTYKNSITISHKKSLYMSNHCVLPWSYLNGYEYIILYNKLNNNRLTQEIIRSLINKFWSNRFIFLDEKCYMYSSGQIKLVKVLCALLTKCDLLIFDEPDSNLDSKNSKLIYDLMTHKDLGKSKKIIFSSHNTMLNLEGFEVININHGLILHD